MSTLVIVSRDFWWSRSPEAATSAGVAAAETLAGSDKPAEIATRGQREAKDITYGDWQKLCFKAGGAPTLCRTSITGKFPTGQMAVRVDLIEREGTARLGCNCSCPSACTCNGPRS